ncbi:MAG: zinc-binding alcohol dehydrogenase family protein [Gammaproteobacteria bacterium]|nr:zinc-binding alcohol dehydrogenase family protein [Gammaproteobacteria bacterium]
MKAVGYRESLPIAEPESLLDVELPEPEPSGRDLLVEVKAVAVNPVDTKARMRQAAAKDGPPLVLGWDAAGVVVGTGPEASLFSRGDEVWYAGSIARPGCDCERHLVDERIVGAKPRSLSFAEAAAMPLTSITAWELLFDRFGVAPGKRPTGETLLVVGAAGGVGSMLTQLAHRLTGMTVIGTASRAQTREWVLALGADHVIDHSRPLGAELERIGIPRVTHVASLTQTARHFAQIVECLAPQGRFGLIDDPPTLDIMPLKRKSVSVHWELMFTRALFDTPDVIAQHRLLCEVAELVDHGVLRTTMAEHYGTVCAENLKRAHALIESGKARGKIVLEGF